MNATQIKDILEKHRLYLRGDGTGVRANLRGANLHDADLRGANLRVADLYGADLYGADLSGANLSDADLYGADLYGADLRGADLRDADLRDAALRDADLRDADLRGANLRGATSNFKILKSISGLKWDIVMKDDLVKVGCQEHTYEKWLSFSDIEITEMDSNALEFYNDYLYNIITVTYRNYKA